MTDNHRAIVRVGDDWLEVRPGQVWDEQQQFDPKAVFRVISVSSDRAKVFYPNYKRRSTKRLSAFRSCELIEDVEKEGESNA